MSLKTSYLNKPKINHIDETKRTLTYWNSGYLLLEN